MRGRATTLATLSISGKALTVAFRVSAQQSFQMRPHHVAIAIVLLCNIVPSAALPQARRALTSEDYARAERALGPTVGRLVSGIPGRPIWLPDGRAAYRVSTPTGGQFVIVDPRRRT